MMLQKNMQKKNSYTPTLSIGTLTVSLDDANSIDVVSAAAQ